MLKLASIRKFSRFFRLSVGAGPRLVWFVFLFLLLPNIFVLGKEPAAVLEKSAGAFYEFAPEEEMIFEVRLDNRFVLERSLNGYYRNDKAYLPLGEICRLLEFPIYTNPRHKTAEGWFLNDRRRFSLDCEKRQVVSDNFSAELSEEDFYCQSDDVYVTAEVLSQWFPVTFSTVIRELVISLTAREKLPMIERLERDSRWARHRPSEKQSFNPLLQAPYKLFSPPAADVTLSTDYSRSRGGLPVRYSAFLANDTLYHTGEMYVSGDDSSGLGTVRIKLGHTRPDGEERPELAYSSYTFGDISPVSMPLIQNARSGTGFYIANTPQNYSSEFGTTVITGNLQEGWSAELYRGRGLVDTFPADKNSNEKYVFENVPIRVGNNDFTVKMYGPFGQTKEDRHPIFVDSGVIAPAKTHYRISAVKNDKELLPVGRRMVSAENGYSLRSEITRGISPQLSLRHDFAGLIYDDDIDRYYSSIEALGSLSGIAFMPLMYGSVGHVSQINGGNALSLKARSNIAGWSLNNEFYSFDSDFCSSMSSNDMDWRNSFSANGRLATAHNLNFRWQRDSFAQSSFTDSINVGLSSRLGELTVLNTFDYSHYSMVRSSRISTSGSTEVRARLGKKGELTAGTSYLIRPEHELSSFNVGGRWQGMDDWSYSARIQRNLSGAGNTTYNVGMMKKYQEFSTGLQFSGAFDGDLRAMLTLNSSFSSFDGRPGIMASADSLARNGALEFNVYQQDSGNELPLKNVQINVGGARITTDETGTAILTGVAAHRRVNVDVDSGSLPDPFLQIDSAPISVFPRPGVVQKVAVSAVMTSEIEGRVFFSENGQTKPVGGIFVQLVDDETGRVMARARSDGDGLYIIDSVRPGLYFVDIDPKQAEGLDVRAADDRRIRVDSRGDIIADNDLVLLAGAAPDIYELMMARYEGDPVALEQLVTAPPVILAAAEDAIPDKPSYTDNEILRQLDIPPPAVIPYSLPELVRKLTHQEISRELNVPPPVLGKPAAPVSAFSNFSADELFRSDKSGIEALNTIPPVLVPMKKPVEREPDLGVDSPHDAGIALEETSGEQEELSASVDVLNIAPPEILRKAVNAPEKSAVKIVEDLKQLNSPPPALHIPVNRSLAELDIAPPIIR